MTLTDHGASFNPDNVAAPDFGADLEDRMEGGLGVFIMRKMMDEIRFAFAPETGNVLTMVKRRETEG
jgi:serine/threonine-protein kinase RsbW